MSVSPFVSAVVPVIIFGMLHYAETAKAKRVAGTVVFPASGLTALYFVSLVFAACLIAGGWYQDARTETTIAGTIWAACILLLWPHTIVLDEQGIAAKHIWRPNKKIPFCEIEYVSRLSNREAIVCGRGTVKEITVTQFHVGADELESELRKRGVNYYREGEGL